MSLVNLHWVLSDPGGERAVDALGLAGQAERLADQLVPQLSVTTNRARYFSFFCWAVEQSQAAADPLRAIHRLEARLALDEAKRHWDSGVNECPNVVGRSRASAYLLKHGRRPAYPEQLYVNTAFATYRPAMRALGLLSSSRRPSLTSAGRSMARAFSSASGRGPKCLGELSTLERSLLRSALGLHHRQVHDDAHVARRRKATLEALRSRFAAGESSLDILERSARWSAAPVAADLHRAFVWEHLSLGLGLAFGMLLHHRCLTKVTAALHRALKGHYRRPELDRRSGEHDDAACHVVAHLRFAWKLNGSQLFLDDKPFEVAAHLSRDGQARRFAEAVCGLHLEAKAESPWIRVAGDKVDVLTASKQDAVSVAPRSYRLESFGQICREVGAA